jgi:hypothetical protein
MLPTVPGLKTEDRPIAVLARQERKSMTLARRGLRMSINDLVEGLRDLRPAEVADCDRRLKARGAYTLSALRQRYSKQYRSIIKRRAICNDEEFYLAQGIVSDTSLPLPAPERKLLDKIIHAYERQKA